MRPLRDRLWDELAQAVRNREHAWRTPVLATVGADGVPNARVVVLREVDAPAQRLVFYTDARSPKVAEIEADGRAALVFWCPRLRWQLRVAVRARCITEGHAVDSAWSRLSGSSAARDYLASTAPGSRTDAAAAGAAPAGGHHLCLVACDVASIDWLALDAAGAHERMLLVGEQAHRLVP